MNTFQLECFLAVASHLNFARAAEQMKITQPSITHQIQTLENELTVKLFRRSTRTVELTTEGHIFLSDAKNIVATSKAAINRFGSSDKQEIVTLAIGYHGFANLRILSSVLGRMAEKYQHLHPRIFTFPDSQLLGRLEDGVLDVVLKLKDAEKKKSSLLYRELGKTTPVCVMNAGHPLSQLDVISVEDLKKTKLVLYDPVNVDATLTQFQWLLAEGRKPSDLHFCDTTESMLLLTASGFGVSILPDTYELPFNLNLKQIPLANQVPFSFGLYYKSHQGKPYLKDFISYMRNMSQENDNKTNPHL